MQLLQIEALVHHQGRHSRTALGARHRHAVHGGVRTPEQPASIPATSIVETFHPSSGTCPRRDRRSKSSPAHPGASGLRCGYQASPALKDIAQDLALGGFGVGISLEHAPWPAHRSGSRRSPHDCVGCDPSTVAASRAPARRRSRHARSERRAADERGRGNAADRAGTAFAVVQREVAFRRCVVLEDLRNSKAPLEGLPDARAQAHCRRRDAASVHARADRAAERADSDTARPMYWNRVQCSCTMSCQKSRAEKRSRTTTLAPATSGEQLATTPPML